MNWNKIANAYLNFYDKAKVTLDAKVSKKTTKSYCHAKNPLTSEQEKSAREFFAPYKKINTLYHRFYAEKTGVFAPEFIPTDMYHTVIDGYFNPLRESQVLDNKCYYPRLFAGIPQPEMVAYRCGGVWLDTCNTALSVDQVEEMLASEPAVFMKAATSSNSGKGVCFLSAEAGSMVEQFRKGIKAMRTDVVIQRPVVQHPTLAKFSEASVNTLRIVTLLTDGKVKMYSTIVRMGVDKRKVDNRGIFCGVREDGTLREVAYRLNGDKFLTHPTNGTSFSGVKVPGYEKALELVKQAHLLVTHFRLISWDIAINETGEPVMLEANLAKGCLDFHQIANGPLFGEDTKKILDEVFGKNK